MTLVVCVQNGSATDGLKLREVDESILSLLRQLKKNALEKEVPFLRGLDFVCPTYTSNVFACLLKEIAFVMEVCGCLFVIVVFAIPFLSWRCHSIHRSHSILPEQSRTITQLKG